MTGPWYPLRLRASRLDCGAPPPLPFVPTDKWNIRKRQNGQERKKETKNSIIPLPPAPPPSLQALSPGHTATSFGRTFPDVSGRQKVHHRLVALLYGEKLRDLHVPASARFPASSLSHSFAECLLLVFPSAAVAEEVLLHLGHSPYTPPAFIVVSVAEPL